MITALNLFGLHLFLLLFRAFLLRIREHIAAENTSNKTRHTSVQNPISVVADRFFLSFPPSHVTNKFAQTRG